jgi:hypothetical protein
MIRLSSRIRRLASVGAGLVTLYGCATHRVDVPSTAAGRQMAVRPGRVGLVIAAPHATGDVDAGDMAAEIARRTGFGLVVASRFSRQDDGREGAGRRDQVSRPREGGPGRPESEPEPGETARQVHALYEQRVLEAAQGPLRFYAEIHTDRQVCAGQIEIATVGVDRELALRLRALAELIRDAHLRANGEVQRLDVLIEPADPVTYRASSAERDGILRLPERGLHIELPRCARRDWRETYAAILADFLAQAVSLSR